MEGGAEGEKKKPPEGEPKTKRKMKTASQLEILEKTYAVETYPSETLRAELSAKLGLSDRQLQMWFCHRRLKDRKPPSTKRQRKESASMSPAVVASLPTAVAPVAGGLGGEELGVGELGKEYASGSGSGSSPFRHVDSRRAGPRTGTAVARIGADMPAMKRYYERPQSMAEFRAISFVEAQLGEPLREDGPILGMEFDPLPPDAFGAPIAPVGQQKQAGRAYDAKLYERPDAKPIKGAGRALQEYQFLPEQPTVRTDSYERVGPSHFYGSPADGSVARISSLSSGRAAMHGSEQVSSGFDFQQIPSLNLLPQQSRQGNLLSPVPGDFDTVPRKNAFTTVSMDAHIGLHPITPVENSFISPDRRAPHDEDVSRIERKRKSEEARIARELEAHEKRIRKELEKQDILRRKREEQIRKEMERHDRERRKEEERLLREKQREEERYQREQRRELERREKFLQKESIRAEKMRLKEEIRREKEAARLKAANDRAIARRIAKESMELIEDERLELMELASTSKGFPSILSLDSETLQNLELFRNLLIVFPPKSVPLKKPFSIKPWSDSEDNVGNLLMVWRFLITFSDVLGLWPFTLDEFVQAFHDYDPRLLNEIHVALLKSIIKDIEEVARTPCAGMGGNQNSGANPGGGHPQIIEGAYAWGFDIRSWQRHLNALTWPEILRQFALSAGFGPQLKKRIIEETPLHDDNEGNDGGDVISNLRNGVAAENAVAIMQERGFSNPRRSRHRLTPGTVKFAAFHVLSLEGSRGLTILEVAERIQKSGLRDLTTSKTPEASIAAALSRDVKLFERTAPSTYCVRSPYRKDPANAESILSEARDRIQIFKNGSSDGEEADDIEREEDSESDVAEDPEIDDLDPESNSKTEDRQAYVADAFEVKAQLENGNEVLFEEGAETPPVGVANIGDHLSSVRSDDFQEPASLDCPIDQSVDGAGICEVMTNPDEGETDIDESNLGAPWVQGLMEGEYSDLSVEERLDALAALIGVAIEGNSIRTVLEERLEAANALKKQMWAEAQLDKRRMKEEYIMKTQNSYMMGNRTEQNLTVSECRQSPLVADVKTNEVPVNLPVQQEPSNNPQNDNYYLNSLATDKCLPTQEFPAAPENVTVQQPGHALEKSRSQLKSYIGHKAEEMYVYRSLPLGQDRRRNRYWQFITSTSRNDPGCGRIFVELRDGSWRLIDSEEGFNSLLASLDTRGVRESHLHMMLHMIEVPFKETLGRNSLRKTGTQSQNIIKSESSELAPHPNCSADIDSPNNWVCVINPDTSEPSSSFAIELGQNEVEKNNSANRYLDFEKWMWQESLNFSVLGAMKYGKKRCNPLLGICDYCRDVFFVEDKCCPSCQRPYVTNGNSEVSGHEAQQDKKAGHDLISYGIGSSLPLRIKLLKAQLALVEVSIVPEALQAEWTDGYREIWGMKLRDCSSAENLLQILTLMENAIKKDFLSSNFETTNELLKSCNSAGRDIKDSFNHGTVPVLPWVPRTTAAVALRLMELDSSIAYSLSQKAEQGNKEAGELIKLPSNFAAVKNIQEDIMTEAPREADYFQEENWVSPLSGHVSSVRGRGARGRGRGRTRGGRSQRRVKGARPDSRARNTATNSERLGQVLAWKGRTRGRGGRQRGRRSVRSRQKPVKMVVENTGEQPSPDFFKRTPTNIGREDWNLDETLRMQPDDAEIGSSDRSDYDDENGQATGDEYDDVAGEDYAGVYNGKPEDLLEASYDNGDDYEVEDRDEEGDMDVDDDDEEGEDVDGAEDERDYAEAEEYINDESDEDNGDQGRPLHAVPNDETASSSEYSE